MPVLMAGIGLKIGISGSGKQASAERFLAFFTAHTLLDIWLRNQAIRAMGAGPLVKLFAGRSLRDDFELPDYRM